MTLQLRPVTRQHEFNTEAHGSPPSLPSYSDPPPTRSYAAPSGRALFPAHIPRVPRDEQAITRSGRSPPTPLLRPRPATTPRTPAAGPHPTPDPRVCHARRRPRPRTTHVTHSG